MERSAGVYQRIKIFEDEDEAVLPEAKPLLPASEIPTEDEVRTAMIEGGQTAGIYLVKNLETGRVLLGSSLNLHGPLNRHRAELKFGSHRCKALQADWDRLGEKAFAFEIVATVLPGAPVRMRDKALKVLEQNWIDAHQPFVEKCYNSSQRIRTRPF